MRQILRITNGVIVPAVPATTGGTVAITSVSEGGSASYDVDTDFTFSSGSVFSAYSLFSGTLPTGTSLNTSTGVISGTAPNDSSFAFTIRATDTGGIQQTKRTHGLSPL